MTFHSEFEESSKRDDLLCTVTNVSSWVYTPYYIRVTSVKVHWIWAEAYRVSACSTDKQTDRHTSDKQTDRHQTDRHTSDRQTDRQTDRQIMLKKTRVNTIKTEYLKNKRLLNIMEGFCFIPALNVC